MKTRNGGFAAGKGRSEINLWNFEKNIKRGLKDIVSRVA
jgi:hypothetical protein